jgi:hypothetical protein
VYFPFLRGKQYELLALRELAPMLGAQGRVVPIIEPVRPTDGSGLDRCLGTLTDAGLDFILIVNPTVGGLRVAGGELASDVVSYVTNTDTAGSWNVGLLLDERTDVDPTIRAFENELGQRRMTLVHKSISAAAPDIVNLTANLRREYDVVDDSLRRRHFLPLLATSRGVTLHDGFEAAARNADYLHRPETQFSDDHLYYLEESWYGFGDYLTIGETFAEGGFTPRAVVIHWTFERPVGGPIMIRSFTSESNTAIGNVGGKFLEAAEKLIRFLDDDNIPDTRAALVMRQHLRDGTYPGLGSVKKLSIQNHLELVSTILS